MVYIGIDPGKNGGVAFIKDQTYCEAFKCPETPHEVAMLIKKKIGKHTVSAMIEKVHSMPRDGVASSFSFGTNYGTWLGILAANKIPFHQVTPYKWQKYYGALPKEKKSRKHKLKSLAFELYPSAKNTLATSDAVLIANYGLALTLYGPGSKR